nr:ribonuclease H-like domain-containing protein [Tanacetum cinerariifolium]
MTFDYNSSELEIHDHNNEPSSSKLVPKVVPPADKTAMNRPITIPPSHNNDEVNIYRVPTAKRTSHCQRRKMPLLEEKRSHCQKDRTAINVKKKLPVKDGSYANWCSSGRDSSRVVLAFTSFFFFCMSSAVNVTVLPDFVPVSPLVVVVVVVSVVFVALAQVESRLVEYKEREVKYIEKIRTLEFYNESNKECIETLKKKLETLKQEKERVDGKLTGLLTALKDLDNLIESQRSDKNKEGLGYTTVPPPPVQLYLSPKKDLSWTGLPECADDTVTDYSRPSPTVESTSEEDQNRNPSVFKNVASPITPKPFIKFVKPKDSQSESKTDKKETPKKPPVKYAKQYRKPNKKPNVRGNQRNWNNLKSRQLGPEFVMKKKACFNCGDFNHLAYECRKRVKKSFTPKPVAHRLYKPSQRPTHSYGNRPFHRTSVVRPPYRPPCVPTVNRKFPTGSTKSPTADMGMKGKAVKPSACSSQNKIDDKDYWDSGCSRHMTGNISYLSDYEPFDGGYVSFGQGVR